ncbi:MULTISPECIES: LysR family transcriptional regulator [unclassified Thalassotalea]|uniref:LysR family transcriptional regulator n=1 Tax=unclassified Thalassotalea TaxID=2614972 RepID=UPI001080120E|nr:MULTISPECIES: LysR family transcriptional regulator [unclassified Thalassotalea]NMP15886.1 LysR family transcriptional regulator [Thalassotalea sp. Y01]QBY04912.1 LysR family transcriptional regulator [Thalassotalea sp. HSM 43]
MDLAKSQLNISHLKMISTIAESETVKEAAERLFITQPALTNRIREAERRLNTELFVRRGRKLIISSAGKRLLHSANKILEELARVEHDIARLTDGVEQVVRLGLPNYSSFKWLPETIQAFAKHMPQVELEINANAQLQPLNALYNGDIDIALICSDNQNLKIDESQYQSMFIHRDELMVCLSNDNPLASKRHLDIEDFKQSTYITNSTVPEKHREYELFFKPNNIIPKKVMQVGFNDAIIELVNVNLGISIMSKHLLLPYKNSHNIRTAKVNSDGLHVYWHLAFAKRENIQAPANLLATALSHFSS